MNVPALGQLASCKPVICYCSRREAQTLDAVRPYAKRRLYPMLQLARNQIAANDGCCCLVVSFVSDVRQLPASAVIVIAES